MIVLGIDPGSRRCGYGAVRRVGSRIEVLESGVLTPGDLPVAERLGRLLEGLSAIIDRAGVAEVAVESIFAGVSPRSALALGQARGVALAAAGRAGLPVYEYAPAEVKTALTGHGRAEKAQMQHMARALFGIRADLSDEADALAVAVCHLARRGLRDGSRRRPRAHPMLRPARHPSGAAP